MSRTLLIPEVSDNPFGWGPVGDMKAFEGLPYQPFSKTERLGHVRRRRKFFFPGRIKYNLDVIFEYWFYCVK